MVLEHCILHIKNYYKQYSLFEVKDEFTGKPLFEVREKLENPDFSKRWTNITDFDE